MRLYSTPLHSTPLSLSHQGGAAVQDRLSEILFRSYFTDGVYPGEDNLVKLGVEAGLAEAEVSDFLDTEELRAEVFAEDRKVKQAGVHGEAGERRDGQRPSLLPSGGVL